MFLTCGKVFSLRAEEVHELVKQAPKIELQDIDEDHDGYKVEDLSIFYSFV